MKIKERERKRKLRSDIYTVCIVLCTPACCTLIVKLEMNIQIK